MSVPCVALATLVLSTWLGAAQAPELAPEPPRLCVVIVVDQLIPEQFERLEPWLTGGLGRLWREGRVYRRAQLAHGLTFTAPGHVSAATGTYPSTHGVVANTWFDRATGKSVYCCEDDSMRMVTSEGIRSDEKDYRRSPELCRVPTISHHIEANAPGARTISICAKDRAAVAFAGRAGELALWWDWRTGAGFVSSNFYTDSLPEWVREWNESWLSRASGYVWEKIYEGELRGAAVAEDEREGEYAVRGWTRSMPHKFEVLSPEAPDKQRRQLARRVYESALSDEFVTELTLRALATDEYGTDETLDLLAVSFASVDTVGHLFGPYSVEVTDVMLRLDALLAKLFADLDQRVGKGRWVCGFTSDHGVLELPERLVQRDVGGVRVPKKQIAGDRQALKLHVERKYAKGLVLKAQVEGIYLDRARMAELGLDATQVRKDVRDFVLQRMKWLGQAYTQEEVEAALAQGTEDPWLRLASRSFDLDRSPDVFTQQKPWHLVGEVGGTTHGSPYDYDRRIPLIFLGPGFEAGSHFEDATSCDLVPTLLAACGVKTEMVFDGRDLSRE